MDSALFVVFFARHKKIAHDYYKEQVLKTSGVGGGVLRKVIRDSIEFAFQGEIRSSEEFGSYKGTAVSSAGA